MKKTLLLVVATAACVLFASALAQAAPQLSTGHHDKGRKQASIDAAQSEDERSAESVFGHNLVEKVRKGAIYIWIFGASDQTGGILVSEGIGSGFIFQSVPEENAAYALTNHHVAGDSAMLQVELWDHSTYKARMVATEPGIDISLIKIFDIDPSAYEVNVVGDSDKVQSGDVCLAIGAPGSYDSVNANRSDPMMGFGLHQTTTMRVVKGKQTDPFTFVEDWSGFRDDLGQQVLTNLPYRLVCQASINGGNSGGPLYNKDGEVIGLNHAGYPAGYIIRQNDNYTIPINVAKRFAYDIINNGKHEVPWMGIDLMFPPDFLPQAPAFSGSVPQAVSEWQEKFYDPKVLKVMGVRDDSPAQRAGLQKDDVIVQFDGRNFNSLTELHLYVLDLPIGKQIPVVIRRGKQRIELTLETTVKRSYNAEFSF